MRLTTLLPAVAASLLLQACGSTETIESDKVDNSEIWRSYTVKSNLESNTTEVRAQFRVSGVTGTTVELKDPSSIRLTSNDLDISNSDLHLKDTLGTSYSDQFRMALPQNASFLFKWTRQDKTAAYDSIKLPTPAQVTSPEANAEVSMSRTLTVKFNGGELKKNETVFVKLVTEDSADSESDSFETNTQSTSHGNEVTFDLEDFKDFEPGPAKIQIRKVLTKDINDSKEDKGGLMRAEVTAKSIAVELVP